jgi:hypothetical protein
VDRVSAGVAVTGAVMLNSSRLGVNASSFITEFVINKSALNKNALFNRHKNRRFCDEKNALKAFLKNQK